METKPETQENESLADLSIKDLMALRGVIELAASRGAFRPSEMSSVGQTFDKLAEFLDIVIAQQRREAMANGATAGTQAS